MNKTQVAQMLTIASGFDRRQVDELTVTAWHRVPDVAAADYDTAVAVVVAHQTSPQAAEYFSVRHLVAGLRRVRRTSDVDVEADVRSAKARGIVPQDWPKRQPLTPEAFAALAKAREKDRQEAVRLGELQS
jgi:hypothetical protein